MSTFVLVPGAGGVAWYWHRVIPLLEKAGHEAIAIDLPGDDESKGIHAYAEIVLRAIDHRRVTLVAQSLGGFTAAIVAARTPLERLVFVDAMIPLPNETAGAYWGNTRSTEARVAAARERGYSEKFDLDTYFLHDVPADVVRAGEEHQRPEADVVFKEPATFERWPDIPIDVVVSRDDRFFPRDFQVRVARERLGDRAAIIEIAGGHLAALSQPEALTAVLIKT